MNSTRPRANWSWASALDHGCTWSTPSRLGPASFLSAPTWSRRHQAVRFLNGGSTFNTWLYMCTKRFFFFVHSIFEHSKKSKCLICLLPLTVSLSICLLLFLALFACLPACLSGFVKCVFQVICKDVFSHSHYFCVSLSHTYLCMYVSIHPSIHPSIHLAIYPSIYLTIFSISHSLLLLPAPRPSSL